ncbi:DEAD/DEAH box helicase [Paeniglutamicibacter cryotolerans]|uniref:ATP-dependent RNA helicase HelY n=1 Tax=Paeniglutamicibacter cryotolerans TaxID=670079 RepID=A0A839QLX8_9MICC|nr:DEAD/DEAH box helicase [Paeniglutamicibacter cryotolerans]MBB2997239.1 ATP-dependent RNA helicase HelY [Paeniglutamicibacter cryotolerans]
MSTPAERYLEPKQSAAETGTLLSDFRSGLDFELDPFQAESCHAVQEGFGVLVAAPTGAGKTVVGEFAVYMALQQGKKAFYTTPIKALSNQKFSELTARYGADKVGLLTGDLTINGDADVVVMTTEVLRNMLYAESETLDGLGFVVMDEVHYLADKFRGAVWEEVIIHLPADVQVVSLSATVSNAEEFGGWLDTVRGDTKIIVSEHRPIPLYQHVMVGGKLIDLFAEDVSFDQIAGDPERAATVNPQLAKLAQRSVPGGPHGPKGHGRGRGPGGRQAGGRYLDREEQRSRKVSRPEMIRALDSAGLLPSIVFLFSRKGCDAAVAQCVRSGMNLTTRAEARDIEQAIDLLAFDLPPDDLEVLGFWPWREGMMRGFAAHHAGLLPIFKEVVEDLFLRGLVKAVFATETLALGVNMPARSVVLEKLEKFNGESHVSITAGEYTQLTGRAGRRGIDVEGHAVVLWQSDTDPAAVAGLASKRTYPLNSSFRPTYNMSLNLTAQFGRDRARGILETSFAQFQADRSVVGLARQVRSREESLAGYKKSMTCHLGDFGEYAAIRAQLSETERQASAAMSQARQSAAGDSLEQLLPGDVIDVPGPRHLGRCVVTEVASSLRDPRPTVLTEDRQIRRVGVEDLDGPVSILSRIKIPKAFTGATPKERKDLAASLRNALADERPPRRGAGGFEYAGAEKYAQRINELRNQLKAHPCHGCPDRENHARWAERWLKLRRETDKLSQQISGRTNTISKIFDRVCRLLAQYGYLETGNEDNAVPQMTRAGQRLRRIYGERDLLTSLVLESGVMDQLNPEELAAFTSSLVYHAKREESGADPRMPSKQIQFAWEAAVRNWSSLSDAEEEARLPATDAPDAGLIWPMFHWARGKDLRECLRGTDLAAGDFVRWVKQVIDVLDQLAKIPELAPVLSRNCSRAVDLIRRGVVSYSNVVD